MAAKYLLAAISYAALLSQTTATTYTVPERSTHNKYIDPDFPGLAFEQASLVEYAQNNDGTVNQFSRNLMDAIYSRTGGKPLIRLGGTSADYARYIPSQKVPALPRAEVNNFQDVGNTTIGPSYWSLTKNFPNAKYIIQLPMAITNISEAVTWAQVSADIVGIDNIHSFEPGNEADLYPDGNPLLQPPAYQGHLDNASYTDTFTKYATAVAAAVTLPKGPFFQAFDTSAHFGKNIDLENSVLNVPTCFDLGINRDGIVKTVAHHYYQTSVGHAADLASGLMNHTAIAAHLDEYTPAIQYLAKNHPHIPFILSEIGNSLNPQHDYHYQATLGSALWQVDFQLYGLSIGIDRFNFQQIMHSGFDLWLPVESIGMQPQVFSNFYAQPFVADFVGSSGKASITRLPTPDVGDNLAAYAMYEDGQVRRIAVVNLEYWDRDTGTRGSTRMTFQLPGHVHSVRVEHLASPEGASGQADSMSYAGSRWAYENLGLEQKQYRSDSLRLQSCRGKVSVDVKQSEAVLIHLQ